MKVPYLKKFKGFLTPTDTFSNTKKFSDRTSQTRHLIFELFKYVLKILENIIDSTMLLLLQPYSYPNFCNVYPTAKFSDC